MLVAGDEGEVKGRGKDAHKTYYRIQPYVPEGTRITIRLGTGRKSAEASRKAIGDLIDSKQAKVDPNAETKGWLAETADFSICETLMKHGLIDELPVRFRNVEAEVVTVEDVADAFIRDRRAGKAPRTLFLYEKAKLNLADCFGVRDATQLAKKDGREFYRWLVEDKGFAENTAKQRLRYARAFFSQAVEDGLLPANPFKANGFSTTQSAAVKKYVPWETMNAVIDHCADLEWRLLFALTRSIPVRVPSEIQELTWADVNREENTILIHSPKTRKIGKHARTVPILPAFDDMLAEAFHRAEEGSEYVFPKLRERTNLGKAAKDLIERAKLASWPKFWNAIRASAETDLMDSHGLRKACQWAGNSPGTAMKNYALLRNDDYIDVGDRRSDTTGGRAAKSDAIDGSAAKSDAVSASSNEHSGTESPQKNAPPSMEDTRQCVLIGQAGQSAGNRDRHNYCEGGRAQSRAGEKPPSETYRERV